GRAWRPSSSSTRSMRSSASSRSACPRCAGASSSPTTPTDRKLRHAVRQAVGTAGARGWRDACCILRPMRWALVLLVGGCAASPPAEQTHDPGPEIDGTYLDVRYGRCSGGVGGTIRCAGSPCDGLDEAACGAAACVSAYTDDGAG